MYKAYMSPKYLWILSDEIVDDEFIMFGDLTGYEIVANTQYTLSWTYTTCILYVAKCSLHGLSMVYKVNR